ncbi:MAG: hypothetical protein ABSG79_17560 [Bryobacteraceae bacterium]|jgi:hypothetical protein
MLREIVLKVGSEGGSLAILRERDADEGWHFRIERNETALCDLLSEEDREGGEHFAQTGYLHSFNRALAMLDRYPWSDLYPVEVHPEFLEAVLLEVRKRGGGTAEARWRERLRHR